MDLVTDAIGMGESPRWHDGRLYVSDWAAGTILAVAPDGTTTPVAAVDAVSFCFDFLPDGRLLVIERDRLLAGPPGGPLEPCGVLPAAGSSWNDVVVDGRGNAYVGGLGFDFGGGQAYPDGAVAPGLVALARPDGSVTVVADDVAFPNGVAVTADNGTLLLAESYAARLTAWDVAADGTLAGRRVWAALGEGVPPDGICLDATGACWYADVPNRRCVRVVEGGAVLDTVELDRGAFACVLGGSTLYVVANSWGGVGNTAGGRSTRSRPPPRPPATPDGDPRPSGPGTPRIGSGSPSGRRRQRNYCRQFAVLGLESLVSMVVRRTYNSRTAAATTGAFGAGWLMSGGVDVSVATNRGGVTLTQPGGAQATFYRIPSVTDLTLPSAFKQPPGVNADLTMPDSTHYRLSFHASKVVQTFTLPAVGAATGWLSSTKDADGNTTTYTATGSPLQTMKATDTTGQRWVAFTYTSGRVTGMAETLAGGASGARSWSYGYDGAGQLASSTDPAGKTARYCYSGVLLTRVITPRGNAAGSTCTAPANAQTTDIAYDAAGAVTSITYRSSAATPIVLQFSAQSTLPVASATATAVTRFTDPYGKTTDYTYDVRDRVTKTVDPLGDTVSATFTTNNDVSTAVSANNSTGGASDPATSNSYDANNNATSVALPTGAAVTATYAGTQAYLPDTSTDDLGNASANTYNAAGHLTSTAKGGVKVSKIYQGDAGTDCGPSGYAAYGGAVCETRDADYNASVSTAEHRTKYAYNGLGELVTVTPPTPNHGRTTPPATTATYDSHSRPRTVTDGKGQTTTYTYDGLDRLTRLDYAGGTYTLLGYDEDGDQTSQADYTSGGTLKAQDLMTYDALDRRATYTNAGQGVETMTWDANSRLTGYTDAGGAVTYGYDSAGSLTSIAEPGGSCTGYSLSNLPPAANLCTIMQVDKSGARLRTVHPGGNSEIANTYDTAGRPTEINNKAQVSGYLASVADFTYSYLSGSTDTVHVTRRTDKTDASSTLIYAFTTQGRLASAVKKSSGGTVQSSAGWCYDPNGNRTNTSTTVGFTCPGTATSSYDGANQQLSSNYGSTGYTYDLTGAELTAPTGATGSTQTRTSTYTTRQQVDTIKPSATGDVLAQTYLGPGNDERLSSAVSATVVDKQVNSPLGIAAYTRVTNGTPGTATYLTRDPQGGLIGLRVGAGAGATHYYVQADNLGSILKVINTAGAIVASRAYDAYGTTTATTGTLLEPFGYTGAYTDTPTGLSKLGARYYDPSLGRFTQTDPETHAGDPNQASPYPYAGNDPVNNTDPTGRFTMGDFVGNIVGGAVVATFTAVGSLGGPPGTALGLIVGGCVGGFIEDNLGTMIDGDEEPTEADAVGSCAAGAISGTLFS